MAHDRFVRFDVAGRPPIDEVQAALEDYVSGAGTIERLSGQRLIAVLLGTGRHPARRLAGAHPSAREKGFYREERFVEVFVDDDYVDVITRGADDYTNAVADGFAAFVAHFWRGTRE